MNRRDLVKSAFLTSSAFGGLPLKGAELGGGNDVLQVEIEGSATALWRLRTAWGIHRFAPPIFAISGKSVAAALTSINRVGTAQRLINGVYEHSFSGQFAAEPGLTLEMIFRIAPQSPVVRFRYVVRSKREHRLTGDGAQLSYLQVSFAELPQCREVQLSVFNDMLHSYTASESEVSPRQFADGLAVIGPILVGTGAEGRTLLLAYEHGAQIPDGFLEFGLTAARGVELRAKKANYVPGQLANGYSTVWMQTAAGREGANKLAARYRRFVLEDMSLHRESRRPYIFYNTWNFQERNKWWNSKPYLHSMNSGRILGEIEVAHRMGIDVFVLDTGWYEKTGDWEASRARFPGGLADVQARLQQCDMRMGLWFDPTAAAKSSGMLQRYRQCVRTKEGAEGKPRPIWETEESYPMCLVSPYSDGFAEKLIQVARETGARYFKWDAIGQYGCDSPHHWHGGEGNTQKERADSYAFQLPLQMARVVEKIAAAVPDVIVDFDVTEGGRAMGLSFLSAGKYFLINNGPYKFNYDIPMDRQHENWNLFFYPGPARTWICRSPLGYDKWIPSVLFLTHYFPDDPRASQLINVASLVLGQNGIWGNLPAVSAEGVEWIGEVLRRYKQVRGDITISDPVVTGAVGGSPEIHEKIARRTGRGVVCLFATAAGDYSYVTLSQPARTFWATEGTRVRFDDGGHAVIETRFKESSAAIVFFGGPSKA